MLNQLLRDENGSNALEYGLVVGLISLAIAVGATTAGASLGQLYGTLGSQVSAIAAQIPG